MAQILIVDDERSMREFLSILLKKEGHDVDTSPDASSAQTAVTKKSYDLVITDLKMPDGSGIEVLAAAKKIRPETEVVVITAFGTTESAVEAMKLGAYDYISKPFKVDEIKITVQKTLEKAALARENRELRKKLEAVEQGCEILGRSTEIQKLFSILQRIAPTGVTVLVYGESGTGKELVARRLHTLSGLSGPFIAVNCSAIPEGLMESELFGHVKGSFTGAVNDKKGLFEEAQGGTIFLDEVGELPLHLQPKLLRVLQESKVKRVGGNREIPVEVRVVSSTNRDLKEEVQRGAFREDLYYRLNVIGLEIPPLRKRRSDIPLLAHHFLVKYSKLFGRSINGFSREALKALEKYDYPGNVRELENMIERAVALETGGHLCAENLPQQVDEGRHTDELILPMMSDDGVDLEKLIDSIERQYLLEAMAKTSGNKTEASKLLNLSFRSFRYRFNKIGIQ